MKTNGINTNLLKAKMADRDLKQYQIAPIVGVSLPTFNRVVLGKSSPDLELIQKITEVLGLSDREFNAIFLNRKDDLND